MAKQKPQRRPAKQEKPVIIDSVESTEDEAAEESAVEAFAKEYGPGIAAGIAVVMLVIAVGSYFVTQSRETNSKKWFDLNVAINSNRADALQGVAENNVGSFLGPAATNKAAVVMIDEANNKFQTDPPAARKLYKSAIEQLDLVLAASESTDELKKIAKFNKARSLEALGKTSESTPLFKELAEDESFGYRQFAKTGLKRSANPIYTSFLDKIKDFDPTKKKNEPAPGAIDKDMNLDLDEDKAPTKADEPAKGTETKGGVTSPTQGSEKSNDSETGPLKLTPAKVTPPADAGKEKAEADAGKKESKEKSALDLTGPTTGEKSVSEAKKSAAEGSVGDEKAKTKKEEKKD